jgi:hypothetical protein
MLSGIFLFTHLATIVGYKFHSISYIHKNGSEESFKLYKIRYISDNLSAQVDMMLYNTVIIIFAFTLANLLIVLYMSQLMYEGRQAGEETDTDTDTDTETETDEEAEEADIPYESQYFEQLEAMPEKELTPEELAVISGHQLIEDTPKGRVYMAYNTNTGTFEYYTDKFSEISYEILDTVARLFTITFVCKQICVNYREEIKNGEHKMLSDIEYDKLMAEKQVENNNNKKERSVFATFKSYNKKTGNNVDKKYYVITEKANKFKYKGKLEEYDKLMYKKVMGEEVKKISYSDFKRWQEQQSVPVQQPEPQLQQQSEQQPESIPEPNKLKED